MYKRPELRIKAYDLNKMIEDFTGNNRPFTAFSSTKIDHIVRFYCKELKDFMYSKFDPDTNEAIFAGPPEFDIKEFAKMVGTERVWVKDIDKPTEFKLLNP